LPPTVVTVTGFELLSFKTYERDTSMIDAVGTVRLNKVVPAPLFQNDESEYFGGLLFMWATLLTLTLVSVTSRPMFCPVVGHNNDTVTAAPCAETGAQTSTSKSLTDWAIALADKFVVLTTPHAARRKLSWIEPLNAPVLRNLNLWKSSMFAFKVPGFGLPARFLRDMERYDLRKGKKERECRNSR